MQKHESCPIGQDIMSESRCNVAQKAATALGLNPGRNVLQVGYWHGVPPYCSVQANTGVPQWKDDVHWNSNWDSDVSRLNSGEFLMICEAGSRRILLYLSFCLMTIKYSDTSY